jgi:hypothetical protein
MRESAVDRLRGTGRWLKQCSFCQKTQDQVGRLIPGVFDAYICNECVQLYHRLLREMEEGKPSTSG